jgi:hypothetical protein
MSHILYSTFFELCCQTIRQFQQGDRIDRSAQIHYNNDKRRAFFVRTICG